MKLNVTKIDENRRVVVGTVKEVKPGTGSMEGKLVTVTLEGTVWNRETESDENQELKIAFWNNDVTDMADRVEKAKVSEGAVIAVEVFDKDGNLSGNRFMYAGRWTYATGDDREKNVIMGSVSGLKTGNSGSGKWARVSVPVSHSKDDEPEWVTVFFNDNEQSNIASRAEKIFEKKGDKCPRAIIVAGNAKEDSTGRKTYSGWDFIVTQTSR